jgi:DNA-binding IclR family transcriptional regulator
VTEKQALSEISWAMRVHDRNAIEARRSAATPPTPITKVGVLDRSVAVLEAVEQGHRSYTAIADATGLTRPTAHRLIDSLQRHGFLMHVGGLGYALGPRLLGLAATAMRELPLRQVARPYLEDLARTTGESVQLYVRVGDRRLCVDAVESSEELRTIVPVGASLPLEKGSAGKVFLAWDRAAKTTNTLLSTRRRGWADSYGEREPGVASVSAPVLGPGGQLLGAVSVSGPQMRLGGLRGKRYAPAVVDTARRIEAALGAR